MPKTQFRMASFHYARRNLHPRAWAHRCRQMQFSPDTSLTTFRSVFGPLVAPRNRIIITGMMIVILFAPAIPESFSLLAEVASTNHHGFIIESPVCGLAAASKRTRPRPYPLSISPKRTLALHWSLQQAIKSNDRLCVEGFGGGGWILWTSSPPITTTHRSLAASSVSRKHRLGFEQESTCRKSGCAWRYYQIDCHDSTRCGATPVRMTLWVRASWQAYLILAPLLQSWKGCSRRTESKISCPCQNHHHHHHHRCYLGEWGHFKMGNHLFFGLHGSNFELAL